MAWNIFPLYKPPSDKFLTAAEKALIVNAIRDAEKQTSGEIRVYIESRCPFVNPVDRAAEVFWGLEMDETMDRNAVLVYVATRDHQYALFADEGIYREMGQDYWNKEAEKIIKAFGSQHYAEGLLEVVIDIGQALKSHFPYDNKGNKNELPDDIVFGQ